MKSRQTHYALYLNQFIQPDTIVPDPYIPADSNKNSYVRNNPINYTDPSGHYPVCDEGGCSQPAVPDWWINQSHLYIEGYGYFDAGHLGRGWTSAEYIKK